MLHILRCTSCKKYILTEKCSCGAVAASPKPPKYSPEDQYGKYRRMAKKEELEKGGLL